MEALTQTSYAPVVNRRLARWRAPLEKGAWWSWVALSVAGLGGMYWVPLAIASHFQYVYAAGWVGILAATLLPRASCRFRRPRRTALMATTGLLLHGLAVASLYSEPERQRFPHTVELKVAWFNLHNSHQSIASLREVLKEDPPDVVAFGEAQFADIKLLPGYEQVVRSKWGGIVLFSRLPIDNARVHDVDYGRGVLEVDVLVAGERVRIFAAHPYKPGTGDHTREFRHLTTLLALAAKETDQVVLLGDLNQTRWSALFHELEDEGQLHAACEGRGLGFTWAPFTGFPLGLGIDHVLVGEGVQVDEFEILPWLEGSDHRALRARLGIRTELGEGAAQN